MIAGDVGLAQHRTTRHLQAMATAAARDAVPTPRRAPVPRRP
jgi:hypothetical protein